MALPKVDKNKAPDKKSSRSKGFLRRKGSFTGFHKYLETADRVDPIKCVGHVSKVQGLLIESRGPQAVIGEICRIEIPKKDSKANLKYSIEHETKFHASL